MSSKYAIITKGLKKSFGKTEVLKGIDLSVERGTMLALLGPNGAGKTTIVRTLTTLLPVESGRVTVDGRDVSAEPDAVRGVIGLTGQNAAVDEYLNGRENLIMMGRLYRLSKPDAVRRADELLEQFDLVKAADRAVKTYSGGMRRRLDLAISLIAAPPIVFLDEPTTGLDPRSRLVMWEIIRGLMKDGATILLTTQYLEEADQLAHKIAVIDHGVVIAEGTADQLKARVGKERLELTFANANDLAQAQAAIKERDVTVDVPRLTLSVATDAGVQTVREVLAELERAKIRAEALSLHRPTLDDVFLKLTGREAEAKTDPTDKEDDNG
jgi:ABC-2 type transport system ATP-binding protein